MWHKNTLLSKFCLFIDPWTRTLDCWSCRNLSTWVLIELLRQEYDRIPYLGAAETNLLKNSRQQKMGYVPHLRVLPLLPQEQPESEVCGEKCVQKKSSLPSLYNSPQYLSKSVTLFQNINMHHFSIKAFLNFYTSTT